tara:strand:+ start:362 stop:754 length:393 start_codon:yes stop_codon:yes gene_type:complete
MSEFSKYKRYQGPAGNDAQANLSNAFSNKFEEADTSKYGMLYKLIQDDPNRKWDDIPEELEEQFSGLKNQANSLHGDDLLKGMMGYYMKQHLPESVSLSPDSISYAPNKNSSYGIKMENGDPTFKGSWRF